jgi:hypothetical protein
MGREVFLAFATLLFLHGMQNTVPAFDQEGGFCGMGKKGTPFTVQADG